MQVIASLENVALDSNPLLLRIGLAPLTNLAQSENCGAHVRRAPPKLSKQGSAAELVGMFHGALCLTISSLKVWSVIETGFWVKHGMTTSGRAINSDLDNSVQHLLWTFVIILSRLLEY